MKRHVIWSGIGMAKLLWRNLGRRCLPRGPKRLCAAEFAKGIDHICFQDVGVMRDDIHVHRCLFSGGRAVVSRMIWTLASLLL
jgi:hypothetical protein